MKIYFGFSCIKFNFSFDTFSIVDWFVMKYFFNSDADFIPDFIIFSNKLSS